MSVGSLPVAMLIESFLQLVGPAHTSAI